MSDEKLDFYRCSYACLKNPAFPNGRVRNALSKNGYTMAGRRPIAFRLGILSFGPYACALYHVRPFFHF